MKMYRNYDGKQSTFGDVSVAAAGANPDNVSVFAAERTSDGALTVMVLNKGPTSAPTTVTLANAAAGAQRSVAAHVANAITRLADVTVTAGTVARRSGAERHPVRDPARDHADRPAGGADRRPDRAVAAPSGSGAGHRRGWSSMAPPAPCRLRRSSRPRPKPRPGPA